MRKIAAIVIIGSICALAFAVLYGNPTPISVVAFGSTLFIGSTGGVILTAFSLGLFVAAAGALIIGVNQSFALRSARNRERRMREGWRRFSDAQLAELLGENAVAAKRYHELLRSTPEASAALAPLSRLEPKVDTASLPVKISIGGDEHLDALTKYLDAQLAERELAFVRACELYSAAYDRTGFAPLLRRARDAALTAGLLEKAAQLQRKLADAHELLQADRDAEAEIALHQLPAESAEREGQLRTIVKRYPDSPRPVSELAELELSAGRSEEAALLLGRAVRINPEAALVRSFEVALNKLPLERALSIVEQIAKGARCTPQLLLETKLAIAINHRATSHASDIWQKLRTSTESLSDRAVRLGAAAALLASDRERAINALAASDRESSQDALNMSEAAPKRVIGLAPQFSTP